MMSSLRRFGAIVGAAALVVGLAACSDASSSSSSAPAEIDYSACSTDDSADQNANVDRSGKGNFPSISGDDTPVIAAGKGSEPTDKVLVKTLKQGDGALVCPGATIKANYVGALWNGTVFDSSYKKGEPVEFSLEQVVKGWTYGLAHTHVGDRVELVIPAALGYGGQARGNIPANSTLVFVVDIVGVATENLADESVLSGATATGEELPAGVTVTGDPGVEPTLTIDESVADVPGLCGIVPESVLPGAFGLEADVDVVAQAASGDEALARMRVADLVSAVPGVGAAHTGRILTELGIAEGRRLKGLGLRQAPALCERLDRVQAAHKPAKPRRA